MKQFAFKNPMQVPRLRRSSSTWAWASAVQNPKIIDAAVEELAPIAGQKPVVTRAKKSIATFKLREGMPIGVVVTLRKERMWEFVDRLVTLALPRVRDFRGVARKAFDGRGNYTLGLREQIIFPEIDYDKIDVIKGMNSRSSPPQDRRGGPRAPHRARHAVQEIGTSHGTCTSMFAKLEKKPKFQVRHRNRCKVCGRSRAYYRKFELCRICLRQLRAPRARSPA